MGTIEGSTNLTRTHFQMSTQTSANLSGSAADFDVAETPGIMHIDERLICSPYSPYVACLREATYYDDKYDNRNGSLFLPSRLCVSRC